MPGKIITAILPNRDPHSIALKRPQLLEYTRGKVAPSLRYQRRIR
jgi:hypothetical protein